MSKNPNLPPPAPYAVNPREVTQPEPGSADPVAEPQPKIVEMDMGMMMKMLGALLTSQAQGAAVQRELLDRELAKDKAIAAKDAEAAAKIERDRKQLRDQMDIKLKNDAARQANCSHKDQRQGSTIFPISNWPDRQLRGTCTKCGIFIQPQHLEYDAAGKATLVPQHPLYQLVLQRDIDIYSEFVPTTGY